MQSSSEQQQVSHSQNPSLGTSNADIQHRLQTRHHSAALARNLADNAFEDSGLRPKVLAKALQAFEQAFAQGDSESGIVTIIDYELHSSEKRLWVIDLQEQKLLFHELTTHGQGSDRNHDGRMDSASNTSGSNQSNVGLLRTAETYYGRHGQSLKMDGLEPGFNDNARARSIVLHPARYADDDYVDAHGKAGRSHGCPALDPDVSGDVIATIKGGKLVFAYYPDPDWLEKSRFLNP